MISFSLSITQWDVIIDRTALTMINSYLSPHMLLMKFLTCYVTVVIRGNQLSARTCYATILKSATSKPPKEELSVVSMLNHTGLPDDPMNQILIPQAQLIEDLEMVVLHENHPDQCVKIGTTRMTTF